MWKIRKKSLWGKKQEMDSLIKNEYDLGGLVHENPSVQNNLNIQQEQRSPIEGHNKLQELMALLDLKETQIDSVDGDMDSAAEDLKQINAIQMYVNKQFPKEPAEVERDLGKHLVNIQETVCNEVQRLACWMQDNGLLGCLIDCYHRYTFEHLSGLLKHINSLKEAFVLMKWVLHTYLSLELTGENMEVIKKLDLLLFAEWVTQAQDRLLEIVQKDLSTNLKNILQNEMSETKENDETFIRLYVDVIQRIDGILKTAEEISTKLSVQVQEVCFKELQMFVKRYISEQTMILKKQAKMAKPEMIHFYKTLNNCKELKSYIQTTAKSINISTLKETVAVLENMEVFILTLLLETIADITESHLMRYFKSDNKLMFYLINAVKEHFANMPCHPDVQQRVMDEVYRHITHVYLKNLVRSKRSKLERTWKSDVGQTVTDDASLLHDTITDLAPGVRPWNLILLKVGDVLKCRSIEALKITVANIVHGCSDKRCTADLELLSALLRWKGDLSSRQVREVLDACPLDVQPRLTSFLCLPCC